MTIREKNINPGVPQCKNYQKQEYTTYMCYIYGFKYQKYNGLHKLEHYREIVQCCKANFKKNPLRLEILKGKSCNYLFKYINYKSKYQIVLIIYSESINLTKNGITEKYKSSEKSELTQFAQL